jgi:hypothetical protein
MHLFKLRWLGFVSILIFIPTPFARASIIAGPVVNPANGHSYYLLTSASWSVSETAANALGGHLATIRNQAENDFVYNNFSSLAGSGTNLWTGFFDPILNDGAAHASNFRWISGEPITYTNWGTNEPNNDSNFGGEYYGSITSLTTVHLVPRVWNDESNSGSATPTFGVAEVVPEPSSAISICLVGLALIYRRRS